jgi:hypothetical protein
MPAQSVGDDVELVVTFVHGTWGRGIFPALRNSKTPFWFEPGGAFRDKLVSELQARGIISSVDIFLWSGANSIRHCDEAAKRLARELTNNVKRTPGIRQVIVAHSHGGNVLARALGYMDINVSSLRVCYLATPFMQLFRRKVERSERLIVTVTSFFLFLIIGDLLLSVLYLLIHFHVFDMRWFGNKQ